VSTLPRSKRLVRILERLGHPVVHAEIEIGEHEDWVVCRRSAKSNAAIETRSTLHRAGEQDDVLGIAVRQERSGEQSACEVRVGSPVEGRSAARRR